MRNKMLPRITILKYYGDDLYDLRVNMGKKFLDIKVYFDMNMCGDFKVKVGNGWEEVRLEDEMEVPNFFRFLIRNFDFIKMMVYS